MGVDQNGREASRARHGQQGLRDMHAADDRHPQGRVVDGDEHVAFKAGLVRAEAVRVTASVERPRPC